MLRRKGWWKGAVWFILAAILLAAMVHAVKMACVAEDSFIAFRFSRHLAAGMGLVWNVGEPAVEGYTNFLWVVILAGLIRSGLNPEIPSQLIGIAATLVVLLLAYRMPRFLRATADSAFDLIAPILLAASGAVATWASSGMETNLFMMFVTAGVYLHVKDVAEEQLRPWSAVALLLAGLTRPEGVLVFSVLWGCTAVSRVRRHGWRGLDRRWWIWCGAFLVPGLVYFLWRYSYFGYLFPNTFYAKGGGSLHHVQRGLEYLALFGRIYLLAALAIAPFVLWGLVRWLRRGGKRIPAWLPVISILVIVYSSYVVYVGGDYMAMFRFMVPILPCVYILLQEALRFVWRAGGPGVRWAWLPLGLALLVHTLVPSLRTTRMKELGFPPLIVHQYRKPPRMHGYADGVALERWHSNRLSLIGRFFAQYVADSRESLLTNAIGAISYYSGMTVYGEHGLVDTHIAHLETPSIGKGLPGHEKGDYKYLLEKHPTYIMVERGFFPRMMSWITLTRRFPSRIRSKYLVDYEVVNAPMVDKQNGEHGYFSFLARKDRDRKEKGILPVYREQ